MSIRFTMQRLIERALAKKGCDVIVMVVPHTEAEPRHDLYCPNPKCHTRLAADVAGEFAGTLRCNNRNCFIGKTRAPIRIVASMGQGEF